jgi:hypothetical protein
MMEVKGSKAQGRHLRWGLKEAWTKDSCIQFEVSCIGLAEMLTRLNFRFGK